MDLAAMMGLVLEQVAEDVVETVGLDTAAAMDLDKVGQVAGRQAVTEFQKTAIDIGLRSAQFRYVGKGRLVFPGLGPKRAAFQRIDVEPVDDEDMVQRR